MAYQIKRKTKINEELELLNKDGSVFAVLETDLNIDAIAKDFNLCRNALIKAQQNIKKLENLEEAHTELGNAFVKLMELVFGAEQTEVILEFYQSDYIEMIADISGFITAVVTPEIEKAALERKKQIMAQHVKKHFGKR